MIPQFLLDRCSFEFLKAVGPSLGIRTRMGDKCRRADLYLLDPFSPICLELAEGERPQWLCDGEPCEAYVMDSAEGWRVPKMITAKYKDYISVDWMPGSPYLSKRLVKALLKWDGWKAAADLALFKERSKVLSFEAKCPLLKALAGRQMIWRA
jgi:hypothetical protein